jgi:dephospho-CoA kinase
VIEKRPRPVLLALTGGIASGKTVASDHMAAQGMAVIDTDVVARQVVEPGTPGLQQIRQAFGDEVVGEDGRLDRGKLKHLVFGDPHLLARLNAMLHPLIRQAVFTQVEQQHQALVVVVIPLLSREVAGQYHIDRVLMIDVSEQVQVERVMQRDQVSADLAMNIMASQPSRLEKLALAQDVVVNNGSLDDLRDRLDLLMPLYRQWPGVQAH